jgi:hypothetical protein
VIRKAIDALKYDYAIQAACDFAGISNETWYEECKRNPAFADEIAGLSVCSRDEPHLLWNEGGRT